MKNSSIPAASEEERDLVARLVRIGAVTPRDLENISGEQVEEITAELPTVYQCRYTVTDMEYQKREITCFELSPEAVNRQFLHRMEGKR